MRERHRWSLTVLVALVLVAGTWLVGRQIQARTTRPTEAQPQTTISVLDLRPLVESGSVLVIDVRGEDSYREGHITGAVHTPLSSLSAQIADLRARAAGRPIVAYCACPTEASSLKAVEVLATHGLAARALVGGYRAWQSAGGRVER